MHSTNSNIDQLYHNLFVHDSPTPSGINALEDAPRRRNTHGTLETQPRRRRDVSAQTPLPHSRTRASFRWTIQEHRHSCGDRDRDRHQTSAIYSSRGFRYRSCLDPLTLVCRSIFIRYDEPSRAHHSTTNITQSLSREFSRCDEELVEE